MLDTLRNFSNQGIFSCYHCHEANMTIKQLKYKVSKSLRENFPNKKALFTTLDVDELLQLEKDVSTNPKVCNKLEKLRGKG
jgi:hypothetical protein